MNCLILAAGLGTRLKPYTDSMPKAMVPVAGKPLLEHQLERMEREGFDNVVVNIHHFGEQILEFLHTHPHPGIKIQVSDERAALLDTGGAIKKAAPLFGNQEPILIHNVDIFHNVNLRQFYSQHAEKESSQADAPAATLLVSHRHTQRNLLFDADQRLQGWVNLQTGALKSSHPDVLALPLKEGDETTNRAIVTARCALAAFSGLHVISQKLVEDMSQWPDRFSIIDFYLASASSRPILGACDDDMQMLDVGKLDTLAQAEQYLAEQTF